MTEYAISASIRSATFAALHSALAPLTPPVRVHHDIDFEWCADDMDVNFRAGDRMQPSGREYLVTGYFACTREEALARCARIVEALETAGVVYQVQLDDEDPGENLLTRAHPAFPPYPAVGDS